MHAIIEPDLDIIKKKLPWLSFQAQTTNTDSEYTFKSPKSKLQNNRSVQRQYYKYTNMLCSFACDLYALSNC